MKRIILFFIAAIFSGSVLAGWTQIGDFAAKTGGVDTGRGTKTFVDKEGIDKNGDMAVMWILRDYENPLKVGKTRQLSSKSLEEYDCKNMGHKTLSFYWYSRHQAKGTVVYSETDYGQMQPIIPNSLAHDAWKIACGK